MTDSIFNAMRSYLMRYTDFRFLVGPRFYSGDILIRTIDDHTFGYYYRGCDDNAGYYIRAIGHIDGDRVYLANIRHNDYIHNVCTIKTVNSYIDEYIRTHQRDY